MSDAGPSLTGLSALKLALMAKEVRAQAQPVLRADPIAIVGMACRVPGGGDTPEAFWALLRDAVDAVGPVPADRWDGDAWFDADLSVPAKSATRSAGFLAHIDGFDAEYFGVLPREAERMDPQQRLFMEVALEALDDAGQTRERLAGSRTGVYIASYHNDYAQLQYGDLDAIDARTLTGTLHSVLANRLSYFLDLHGPSLSIDTACSSSLVAVHLACQSLRFGESDLALAGGVSLIVAPELMVSMSKVGFMAVDGRCKTFDAEANGFGRGEGCSLVVLKRLSDAIADGDRILAVVRGSAVNQDGHSTLLAAPHGPAQEALIREALASAQLEPARIGYVEAHGTGTALGDPIEVEAIAATLGRVSGAPTCWLGSAKANIGHLEAAAGATGLIKTVLALRHEAVPPQVHFHRLSPHITLTGTRLDVPTAIVPWPRGSVPRVAAVSSFGVGGTNAHVIVEEAPRLPAPPQDDGAHPRVLLLSAHSAAALQALARAWVDFLPGSAATIDDLCFSAAQRRTALDHRLAVLGSTKDELAARLAAFLREGQAAGVVAGRRPAHAPARLGLVFSGQGPQWFAMGRELLAAEPVFRAELEKVDALLKPLSGWSLLDELARDEATSRLDQTEIAQPALFGLQVALAALWRSFGVTPDALVGHSIGEIAALHVAGVFDLATAVRIVWHRGRLMQQATGLGRMASVGLDEARALEHLRAQAGRLDIAAINAPRSLVLSGETAALDAALAALERDGVSQRLLPVQYAFHSAQMVPFAQALVDELTGLRGTATHTALYSTVTGTRVDGHAIDAAYFGRNVRQTVRFADAIGAMAADGIGVFLEVGPHPVLGSAIAECLAGHDPVSITTSLRRGRAERETMLQAAAALHVAGIAVDWSALQGEAGGLTALPRYPWQHKRYWLRQPPAKRNAPQATGAALHPLLGRELPVAGISQRLFEGSSAAARHWLADHRIFGRLLLPAAAAIEMLAFAAGRLLPGQDLVLNGFTMHRPLVLTDDDDARWQVVAQPHAAGEVELALYHAPPEQQAEWQRVASLVAQADASSADSGLDAGDHWTPIASDTFYSRFDSLGVAFGPNFRVLDAIERAEGRAQTRVSLPDALQPEADSYSVHPVLIDAALQLCSAAAPASAEGEWPARVLLPLGVDRMRVRRGSGPVVSARAVLRGGSAGAATLCADVVLLDARSAVVVGFEGLRFAPATALPGDAPAAPLYTVAWEPLPAAAPAPGALHPWLVFVDHGGVAARLIDELSRGGRRCLRVQSGPHFSREGEAAWRIDPSQPEQFERLLREVAASAPGFGVVYAAPLDLPLLDQAMGCEPGADDARVLGGLLHLAQALARRDGAPSGPLVVLTRGAESVTGEEPAAALCPQAAAAFGLVSVVAAEHPALHARVIDLDPAPADEAGERRALAAELESTAPLRLARRAGQRWQPRLQRHASPAATAMHLVVARPGSFDGLAWEPMAPAALASDAIRVQVAAAGLNFRDVLLTLGMYPGGGVPLGAECAGVVTEIGSGVRHLRVGDRVFGYAPAALATELVVPAVHMVPMPAGMAFEEAAALPVAYLTAHHGLVGLAGLRRGERVLVHAGAGGVGMAAVQLALRRGATVYATAGSPAKRERLFAMGVTAVMDSRTLDFADAVLRATGGAGVDVVLNSLAGEFIPASLRTLARGGRFLELGKRDVWSTEAVAAVRADVRYHLYDLASEVQAHPALLAPMVDDLLAGLADGSLAPLPVTLFDIADAADAMRHMAQAKHIGKIVLQMGGTAGTMPAIAADASYWITGGLGGLGLATARWLVASGARHLMLSGRHAPDADALAHIEELRRAGAVVRTAAVDAADRAAMRALLDDIQREAPLRGVVHAAGSVHDAVLLNQRWPDAAAVLRGKAQGAWVLHELTRSLPLDFFVLYSAAGLLLGAAGQGLYPAANAQLDALAQARRRLGLPALSVAWGAWAEVGMAARQSASGHDPWAARGLGRITPADGFRHLAQLLVDGVACAAVLPIDWGRFLAQHEPGAGDAFFGAVAPASTPRHAVMPAAPERRPAAARLKTVPAATRREALLAYLAQRTRHVLGLDADTPIDPRAALKDAGLDSLMAVELRNLLNRESAQPLPVTLLFDHPTLDALADHLAHAWDLEIDAAPRRLHEATHADDRIDAMSDDEAEAALLAELERSAPGAEA